ncbi:MAG: cation diffusion facilitator family transporter [Acidimicrobiales bacterium]
MAGGSTKAIAMAFFANLGIAIAKFVGFAVTGSSSMLAEAVHSVADTGNQGLLIWGNRQAKQIATPQHPFGYGRERYFWAFVVSLVLFSVGSLFAIFEGIDKIRHPHEIDSLGWAIGILVFAMVLEAFAFRTAFIESKKVKGSHSWPAFIRRSRTPELPVVLLEDFGAMIGLVLAFVALMIANATGNARWDGVGTLSIGILLGLIAIVLAYEMKSLLIGEGALPEELSAIEAALEGQPQVERVIHMRTQYLGPEELLVGAKVHFSANLDGPALTDAVDHAEAAIRDAVPKARIIYLEPDLYETAEASPIDPDQDNS